MDEMVDRLLDILADKLTERLSAGHKELYTAWAGVQAYESTHTGMSTKRTSEKHKAVSHGNPGPI